MSGSVTPRDQDAEVAQAKTRAGFYARVSTEEQRDRQTIGAQVDFAKRQAVANQWELRLFLDEGVSGTIPLRERPAGAEFLAAARKGEIDLVATYRVDRLGRKLRVVLDAIEELRLPYRSLTEPFDTATPLGRAMLGILGAFAELERDTFIERSRAGIDRVAHEAGRWLGGIVPFGYRKGDDLRLVVDERPLVDAGVSQADVVGEIFRRCAVDGWSTQRIADELNARRIPTTYARDGREVLAGEILGTRAREGKRKRATAGTWTAGAVLRILKGEIYAGRHLYGRRSAGRRELIPREMPAIVSPALFERARRQLAANMQWQRAHPKRVYQLRGLLTCRCGHALVGQSYRTKSRGEVRQYGCVSHPKGSPVPYVKEHDLEPRLWGDVVRFFEHPDEVLRAIACGASQAGTREDAAERELLELASRLHDLETQEGRLLDTAIRGAFSAAAVGKKTAELAAKREVLERRMAEVRGARAVAARAAGETVALKKLLATLAQRARNATPETRAEILRVLVKRTCVERAGRRTRVSVLFRFAGEPAFAAMLRTDTGSSRQRGSCAPDTSRRRPPARSSRDLPRAARGGPPAPRAETPAARRGKAPRGARGSPPPVAAATPRPRARPRRQCGAARGRDAWQGADGPA